MVLTDWTASTPYRRISVMRPLVLMLVLVLRQLRGASSSARQAVHEATKTQHTAAYDRAPLPTTTLVEAARVPTRGAAGWAHFELEGRDFLAVANFFTSAPRRRASMTTDSVLYAASLGGDGISLELEEVQRFQTAGAHGVEHFVAEGRHYLAYPNYYGGDAVVYRWSKASASFSL
eukprot:SAG11_NODE_1511_length_4769_cov_3.389722_6_plen_176_part_00